MARLKIRQLSPRRIIRWLLGCAILAVLSWVFFLLAGRALCYVAIRQIGDLTNTKIRTESVDFRSDGSVYIKNLVIRPFEEQGEDDTIIDAEMVFARFSLGSLLKLKPRLETIDVNNFIVNAQYNQDTHEWNISALKLTPPKGSPDQMPRVRLNEGTLQYTKISKGQTKVAVSVPITAKFESSEKTEQGYDFEITTATLASGYGQSRLTGSWKPGSVTITGGLSSADIPELEMTWIVDVLAAEFKYDENHDFSLDLHVKKLQSRRSLSLERIRLVGPAFLESSNPFAAIQEFFDRYEPRGSVDIELEASGNFRRLGESTLSGDIHCKDVEICHFKFQYPIEHLTGRVGFTESSVTLSNLVGHHGDTRLLINGWCRGFGSNRKYQVQLKSDSMPLDEDVFSALTPKQQEFWCVFSPTGRVAIDYWFTQESPTQKRARLEVDLLGGGSVYQYFPYPLENLSGQLAFENNEVIFTNVASKVGDRQITVNGRIATHSTDKPMYDVSVNVKNLPLDSTLEKALPENQQAIYTRYQPEGLADGWVRIMTQDDAPSTYVADLSFKEASLKIDRFPLAFTGISAKAAFMPDMITIKEFSGRYNDGSVSMTGQIRPAQQQGQSLYDLAVTMEQMPLNDNLFDLLPDTLKKNVTDLKPDGNVNITAQLSKEHPDTYFDYDINMECLGNSMILPDFCYHLEEMTGNLTLDPNRIALKEVNATLGSHASGMDSGAKVSLDGEIVFADGVFHSALMDLSARDVPFDEQFGLMLPESIRFSYGKLSPTGWFDLNFPKFEITRTPDDRKSIEFAGNVTLRHCGFSATSSGFRLSSNCDTEGLYKTGEGFISCRAVLDGGTLMVRGKSFTDLQAGISFDPDSRIWSTEDLIANCYSGRMTGRFQYQEPGEQPGQYLLQAGLVDVDLKQFLSDTQLERAAISGHTSGKMNGSLCLHSKTGNRDLRIGTCKLLISDMQVGKLSPLTKLLQVLRFTEPTDFAFDQMVLDSYIKSDELYVRNLDLSGKDLAFFGSGRMDLKKNNLDLILTARGPRLATDGPSVLQSLTEGLGQAVVRISVTGNIDDPKVKTEPLPVIEGTLQVLGARPSARN